VRISSRRFTILWVTGFCLCTAELVGATSSDEEPAANDVEHHEKYDTGATLRLDNDYFSMSGRDYDYTGGDALTFYGRRAAEWPISLDGALDWVERALSLRGGSAPYFTTHALQIGHMAFTPEDLRASRPIYDDRPYASLVYLSNNRTYIGGALDPVYQTSVTLGFLGLPVAEQTQRFLHKRLNMRDIPNGWDYQISEGGEPTLRVTVGREQLLAFDSRSHDYDAKWATELSVGYVTELNISVSGRWGDIATPWWSVASERYDFQWQPAPETGDATPRREREFYVYAGAKVWVRVYNVFMQGQFRDSAVTFDAGELNPLLGEVWLGATWQFSNHYRVNYIIRTLGKELKNGTGSRNLLFAGVQIGWNL
jgi:hypothetical protein